MAVRMAYAILFFLAAIREASNEEKQDETVLQVLGGGQFTQSQTEVAFQPRIGTGGHTFILPAFSLSLSLAFSLSPAAAAFAAAAPRTDGATKTNISVWEAADDFRLMVE